MKMNEKLQQDVEDAIKWQPSLSAAEIGVTAKDGIRDKFLNTIGFDGTV